MFHYLSLEELYEHTNTEECTQISPAINNSMYEVPTAI